MRIYMCDKCRKQVPLADYWPIYFDHPSHFSNSESAGLCAECFESLKKWIVTKPVKQTSDTDREDRI